MSILKEFRVTLETVTPLFLGGAETRGNPVSVPMQNGRPQYTVDNVHGGLPELRPPSFRGSLRYWLRTLSGEMTGGDLKIMHDLENSIFGSAASENGASARVRVQICEQDLKPVRLFKRERTEIVSKNGHDLKQPSGRDYLYWSMAENRNQPPKKYYPEGSRFEIVLSARFLDEDILQKAVASLWMLVHFGGMGSRSRRTAGSLSAASPEEFKGLGFQLKSKSLTDIANELYEGLEKAQEIIGLPLKPIISNTTTPFDMISLKYDTFQSWVIGSWDSPDAAVTAIGKSLRDFRTYSNPDHDEVFKWLNGNAITNIERSAFGLPIPYKYSSRNKPEGVLQGRRNVIERRASPIWLKISKTGGNPAKYVVIATLFKSAFLPSGEQLFATSVRNETNNTPPPVAPPTNYSVIEKWIDTIKNDKENYKVKEVV